jgi:hypothetical protein
MLRDAVLRTAPQHEACGIFLVLRSLPSEGEASVSKEEN